MIRMLSISALLLCATPALAQPCAAPAGWAKPARHVAARNANLRFGLKPNSSAQLQLHAEPSVAVPIKQDRAKQTREFAGLAALDVVKAGKLDVSLSDRAYVDLVRDGRAVASSMHGHGKCAGIAKTVTFDVKPGRYIVQIADAKVRSVRVGFVQK